MEPIKLRTFTHHSEYGGDYVLDLWLDRYMSGNAALYATVAEDKYDTDGELDCAKGEPYDDFTVNVPMVMDSMSGGTLVAIPTYHAGAEKYAEILEELGVIGEYLTVTRSGYATIPVYKLSDKVAKLFGTPSAESED